jgi:hypothetical protein
VVVQIKNQKGEIEMMRNNLEIEILYDIQNETSEVTVGFMKLYFNL